MKAFMLIFSSIVLLQFTSSCQNSTDVVTYEKSLKKWQELKKEKGDSYQYTVEFSNVYGTGWNTTVKVENGVVTERTFATFDEPDYDSAYTKGEVQWKESGAEIGKHEDGKPAITFDEVYEICKTEYLSKAQNDSEIDYSNTDTIQGSIFFYTNEDGIMNFCGYYEEETMESYFHGYEIVDFKWLGKE